jgi:hypothetical protein
MYNLSAAMGPRWAEICTEFTERIKKLGPSPIWLAESRFSGTESRFSGTESKGSGKESKGSGKE